MNMMNPFVIKRIDSFTALFVIVFATISIQNVSSLECYACNDDSCADVGTINTWGTIRCPNTMYCLKFSVNDQPFARNCGRNCESVIGTLPPSSNTYCYECNGDLCNGAIPPPTLVQLSTILLSFITSTTILLLSYSNLC